MPAVELTPVYQTDLFDGTEMPWVDADAGGHTAPNREGMTAIWIENSGSELTATFKTKRETRYHTFPDHVFTVPNGTVGLPTLAPERFTDISSGLMEFSLSRVTSVRVAAIILEQVLKED